MSPRARLPRACLLALAWPPGCGSDEERGPTDAAEDPPAADAGADLAGARDAGADLGARDVGPDASQCGDGVCDLPTETDANCPLDCGCAAIACSPAVSAPAGCNCDACCADTEFMDCCDDADSECGIVAPCGNGTCEIDCEDGVDCPADCTCGDGVCDFTEDSCTCLGDCCGDGYCDPLCEDSTSCSADC